MSTVTAIPDPLVGTYRQLGERTVDIRNLGARIESMLAHMDELRDRLKAEGITVDIDLGEVLNAAAAARRQVEAGKLHPKTEFALPRAS